MNIFDEKELNTEIKTDFAPAILPEEQSPVECQTDDILPMMPLRNMALFPNTMLPVTVGRRKSIRLVRELHQKDGELFVCAQIDANVENPTKEDVYAIGTIAHIEKLIELPNGNLGVLLEGKQRARLIDIVKETPYLHAQIELIEDAKSNTKSKKFEALCDAIKDVAAYIIKLNDEMPDDMAGAIRNFDSGEVLINFISANFDLEVMEKQLLLNDDNLSSRGEFLLRLLYEKLDALKIKQEIKEKAKSKIDRQQKEYLLQQQARAIQEELGFNGEDDAMDDFMKFSQKGASKKWPEEVKTTFQKELNKLRHINPSAPDYSVQYNYLDTMVNLPWGEMTKDNFDLYNAAKVLDKDHFGMEKIKERILEYIAVLRLKGDMKSPIICLYGAPGVGKTSLAKSIANALGRKYVRMSLGGVHDEAEIRGHRRTYIGAMPGRIIQNINKCGSSNPVFVLDEIDKINKDIKGDPESALLEVLDPEQNTTFHDNFLDVDYDLSNVLFIATANDINAIAKPLLDRMEMIEVSGYVTEEKVEIAKKHLIPKQIAAHGLRKNEAKFTTEAIVKIINDYTAESGVRSLERHIAKILRRGAKELLEEPLLSKISVKETNLERYLGVKEVDHERYDTDNCCGVVTGLAWTRVGGEILQIESAINTQKGSKLTLTGNLGDVMKESAQLSMEYIKANCDKLGITAEDIENHCVHIHVPEGATPKDGPSAGIAILTSLVSSFTQKPIREHLAMTGEITLRGKVLPVGGIKEKVLAAKRAGIKEIIICEQNRKDVNQIKAEYLDGITFHYVKTMGEVVSIAFNS